MGTWLHENVQESWRKRWEDPVIERPSCYNRPAFRPTVTSDEFEVQFPFRMSEGCPHWKPGGNAHVRPHCDSNGGKRTPWSSCAGCKWKTYEGDEHAD